MLITVTRSKAKIYMYPDDHPPPHVHAIKADKESLIDRRTLKLIEGELLPKTAQQEVIDYIAANQHELLNQWHLLNPPTHKHNL